MAYQTLREEYMQMPVVTRAYTTACVITTLAVQLDLVSPFQLYFNPILIIKQYQFWRLITAFLFFGTVGFNFFFNMIFTYRYCRMLEEGSFRSKTADFVMMFLFGGICMIGIAFFVNLLFLGQAFTIMLVYVWSRRNPFVSMNFFGLLTFQHEQHNKMSLHNLATVFGPTVLRPGSGGSGSGAGRGHSRDPLAAGTVDVMAQAGILHFFLQTYAMGDLSIRRPANPPSTPTPSTASMVTSSQGSVISGSELK